MVEKLAKTLWEWPVPVLLGLGGLFIAFYCSSVQIRYLPLSLKLALGGLFSRQKRKEGTVTRFQAVCTALGGTVGTGNITGVAAALSLGGPGAIFWMWISAIIGMGIKYAEVVLAVKFRERTAGGELVGGPMYYIKNGLSPKMRFLAPVFCLCGAAAAFGVGNMAQVGSIADSAKGAVSALGGDTSQVQAMTGVLVAAFISICLSGGTRSRASTVSLLVPAMSLLYIIGAGAVIGRHMDKLPGVLYDIFRCAFSPNAAVGGGVGSALNWGFRRGMLSHEAGMGSSPIAHGSADTDDPARQGLLGVFEVFFDTIVICTLTALMVLCSGVELTGSSLCCSRALATVFGQVPSAVFLAAGMALFAFSSMLGWSLYGERCAVYLFGERAAVPYRGLFALAAIPGGMMTLHGALAFSDILNAFMALPNMVAVLMLLPAVREETERRL